jgi:hypothetical protein
LLGYLGGQLSCTPECKLSTSGCKEAGPSKSEEPSTARFEKTAADALDGEGAALALNGTTLGAVTIAGTALRFRAFDARTLAPLGPARESPALNMADDPARRRRAHLVPFRDGFLAAKGYLVSTELFRVTRSGELDGPRDAFPNSLPLFLAGGAGGVMVGLEPHISGYPVELVRLDADGHPMWRPVRAIEAARPSYDNPAVAVFIGGEWLIVGASSVNDPVNDARGKLFLAHVTQDAVVRLAQQLPTGASRVAIASDGQHAFLVFTHWGGVFATDLLAGDKAGTLRLAEYQLDRFDRVLGAELRAGVLTAYVSATRGNLSLSQTAVGAVYRVRATFPSTVAAPELILSGPGVSARAGLLVGGTFYLLHTDATGVSKLSVTR